MDLMGVLVASDVEHVGGSGDLGLRQWADVGDRSGQAGAGEAMG